MQNLWVLKFAINKFDMEKTRYHLEEDKDFPAREIFIKILRCYPPEHNKYEKSKDTYKRKIIPFMIELKDFLLNKTNLSEFLDKAFFDKRRGCRRCQN